MSYTCQITDHNLATPEGTDVVFLKTKDAVIEAWNAAYLNTWNCETIWGGAMPAMSDALTVTVWHGRIADVTDVYPYAEVTLGRRGNPVWRRIH